MGEERMCHVQEKSVAGFGGSLGDVPCSGTCVKMHVDRWSHESEAKLVYGLSRTSKLSDKHGSEVDIDDEDESMQPVSAWDDNVQKALDRFFGETKIFKFAALLENAPGFKRIILQPTDSKSADGSIERRRQVSGEITSLRAQLRAAGFDNGTSLFCFTSTVLHDQDLMQRCVSSARRWGGSEPAFRDWLHEVALKVWNR